MNRLLMFTFIALSTQLSATTYFIRTDGNDSCNGTVDAAGSSGNCAKRTMQAGVNLAQAGDTVIVHSGSYTSPNPTFSSARSGSAGNLLTIMAAAGETVTISRLVITHNYNVVRGFTAVSSGSDGSAGIQINGSYNQALYNTIVGNCQPWNSQVCNGMGLNGSYNIASHNIFDGNNNNAANSFMRAVANNGNNNEISYSTFQNINTPERLFEIYGDSNLISHNEIKNCKADYTNGNDHPDIFQGFNSSSTNTIVEYNYFHEFGGQWIMFADWQVLGAIHHWTFRNNVFANIGGSGYIKSRNIYFYNNTFYRVGYSDQQALIFSVDSEGDGSNGQFRNNILIGNASSTSLGMLQTATTTVDHNYFATPTLGARSSVPGTTTVNGGSPQFVSAGTDCTTNACDFHIGSTSAVKDRGAELAEVRQDKDGVPRPQGPVTDIGAYEYVVGALLLAPSNVTATVH